MNNSGKVGGCVGGHVAHVTAARVSATWLTWQQRAALRCCDVGHVTAARCCDVGHVASYYPCSFRCDVNKCENLKILDMGLSGAEMNSG